MASCDEEGVPVVGRALACRVDGDGVVRLVLRTESNEDLLRAVATNAGLAVTFTQPSTHRSIQFKGTEAYIAAPDPGDRDLAERQAAAFVVELLEDGLLPALAERYGAYDPERLSVIEFAPLHAFEQTPGPGAGAPLQP